MKHIYLHSKKVFILILLMLFSISFYAQETKTTFAPYWYLKASFGASYGHTDLSRNFVLPDKDLDYLSMGGDIGLGRQFSPVLGAITKFYRGFLDGQKPQFAMANFETDLYDFTINGTVNFSNLILGYKDRKISFHGLVGIGQTHFKSISWVLGTINSYGYKGSPAAQKGKGINGRKIVLNVPMGLGVDYKINDRISANADVTLKWTDTDVLDAKATAGSANDFYNFFSAGVTYKLEIGIGLKKMVKDFDLITIKATPKVLEEKGDMIDLEITGTIPGKYFGKKVAVLMQPVLVYEGGQTKLNPFTLKGEDVMGEGELIKSETGGTFSFKDTFKYTPEMNKSELIIVPLAYIAKQGTLESKDDIIAGTKYAELGERKLADGVIYTSNRIANQLPQIVEQLPQIVAEHGYQKEVIVTKTANIYFAKNLYNLNWNLKLNKCEHSQKARAELKDFILRGWEIKSINIDGWASPEGEETFNVNLSENRAKTAHKHGLTNLKKMLKDKSLNLGFETIDEVKFIVNFHGQDWNGFTEAIKKSDIADKDAIFNVISKARSALQKEQEIRNMIVIYPEIEKDILPPLRRAEIAVNAYEPKKTDEEISALVISDPKALNLSELLYAAHMAKSADKLGLYKSIMKQYPKCWKSLNNAAVIYMKDGKLDKAEALLKKAHDMYPKVALVINNLGVLNRYKSEYGRAEKYFLQAQDLGFNVNYNLGVIEIDKGNYEKALKLFENKTCDYNVALAQILTGKYAKAENNLKCAKECEGSIAYLMAVIGARTNNASMVYENLIKAIKVYDGYKAVAKEDREFINFENTLDFKAIVE